MSSSAWLPMVGAVKGLPTINSYHKDFLLDDQEGEDSLLAFNISPEKFQLLPLPNGVNNVYFAGELRGRFAVIGTGEKRYGY